MKCRGNLSNKYAAWSLLDKCSGFIEVTQISLSSGNPQSCLQGNPYLTKNPIKLAVTVFPLLNWPKHCQCLEELRAISSDALYIFVRFTVFLLFEKLYYTTKGYLFSEYIYFYYCHEVLLDRLDFRIFFGHDAWRMEVQIGMLQTVGRTSWAKWQTFLLLTF